jgi:DNA-binding transcriptional MerR regulator
MKELVEATGVPKSTILHYLNQGLLPEPLKTSPNMAYYPPQTVDRVRFIQHMQRHHRLSLSEIKQVLESKVGEADLPIRLELHEVIFGQPQQEGLLDRAAFCEATGLTEQQLDELLQARLLMPLAEESFGPEDVSMGQMYAARYARGFRMEDITYYVELGEQIVDREMALRRRMTGHLPVEEDAALTIEMVKSARMCRAYIIDRLFQHRVAVMRDLKEGRES